MREFGPVKENEKTWPFSCKLSLQKTHTRKIGNFQKKRCDQTLKYSKINVNLTESNTVGLDKEFFLSPMVGIILILLGIEHKIMSPVCRALSLFGFVP